MAINGVDPEKLKLKMENTKLKGELKKEKQRKGQEVEGIVALHYRKSKPSE